jgi:hypothetical protein
MSLSAAEPLILYAGCFQGREVLHESIVDAAAAAAYLPRSSGPATFGEF